MNFIFIINIIIKYYVLYKLSIESKVMNLLGLWLLLPLDVCRFAVGGDGGGGTHECVRQHRNGGWRWLWGGRCRRLRNRMWRLVWRR